MTDDLDALVERALHIAGRTMHDELRFLYELAVLAPDGPAVEVGILHGRSMSVWTEARVDRGPIYGVDAKLRADVWEHVPADTSLVDALSWDGWAAVPEALAFCFIDADHGLEAFPKDILPWAARIMPGGVLAFHDYEERPEFAVIRYVDWWQSMVHWHDLGLVRSTKAFRRPA